MSIRPLYAGLAFGAALSTALGASLAARVAAQTLPRPGSIVLQTGMPSDQAAYLAISTTPLGTLPPTFAAALITRSGLAPATPRVPATSMRAQFGHIDGNAEGFAISRRTVGLALDVPLSASTLSLDGGVLNYFCGDLGKSIAPGSTSLRCKSGFLGGASWTAPIVSASLGPLATLVLGVDGAIGFGTGDLVALGEGRATETVSATTWSAGLGLPIGVVARSGKLTLIPHLAPRVAWGRATVEDAGWMFLGIDGVPFTSSVTASGTRFMLGGGVGILFGASPIGLDVGFQNVFVKNGTAMVGAALRFSPR